MKEEPKTIEPDAVTVVAPAIDHEMLVMASCWQLVAELKQAERDRVIGWLNSRNAQENYGKE